MFDELRLTFLDNQNRFLAEAEGLHLFRDQGVGHVQHIDRQAGELPNSSDNPLNSNARLRVLNNPP